MKNDKLKPFVHKIKGAKNYAFYDMLNGNFYHFEPSGSIEAAREQLREADLIFETDTFVPFKTALNVIKKEDNFMLKKIQIRINGSGEDTCWRRIKNKIKKNPMSKETANKITHEFRNIPIQKLIIEAELFDINLLSILTKELKFGEAELFIESNVSTADSIVLGEISEKKLEFNKLRKIPVEEINVNANDFFYNQVFNSCLGHQIALDTQGEIKPCLWWPDTLGNIHDPVSIKDMILAGKFDNYWEITKDGIEICKVCEYRYNCMDCRIHTPSLNINFKSKPTFCKYDPYTGEGK